MKSSYTFRQDSLVDFSGSVGMEEKEGQDRAVDVVSEDQRKYRKGRGLRNYYIHQERLLCASLEFYRGCC